MPARLDDILQAVGGTPIVRLNKLAPPGINIFAKLESFNPMGSVKDRLRSASSRTPSGAASSSPGRR
jgi:cysteine synthase A